MSQVINKQVILNEIGLVSLHRRLLGKPKRDQVHLPQKDSSLLSPQLL